MHNVTDVALVASTSRSEYCTETLVTVLLYMFNVLYTIYELGNASCPVRRKFRMVMGCITVAFYWHDCVHATPQMIDLFNSFASICPSYYLVLITISGVDLQRLTLRYCHYCIVNMSIDSQFSNTSPCNASAVLVH